MNIPQPGYSLGPGFIAPGGGRPIGFGQKPSLESLVSSRMEFAQGKFDAGELDVGALQELLESRYGDSVKEAFGEDGSIDFARLEEIVLGEVDAFREQRVEQRMARAEEAIDEGALDPVRFQSRLEANFGDAVNEAFGEDGSIDFTMLQDIILAQLGDTESTSTSAGILDSTA